MAITVDWANKIVNSTASITDIPVLRTTLRGLEDSEIGILYEAIITYKGIDLGGGAMFPAIDFINGYQLKFPTSGNYEIKGGNLRVAIIPVAGVFVDRTQSAAYAVGPETGISGLTSEESEKLMVIPSETLTQEEHDWLMAQDRYSKNTKVLKKIGNTLHFIIYDESGSIPIMDKEFKDIDGNDVTDIKSGVIARELKSTV